MIFSYIPGLVDPNLHQELQLKIVTGIGFLGAGLILKSEEDKRITNLTTALTIYIIPDMVGIINENLIDTI
jgi:putative Mg2+ transporter-C (MgtC) family protein